MTHKLYNWSDKRKPPLLEAHSTAKHKLLKSYLERYIKMLTADPRQDTLRLNIIDGFCGGGIYRHAETEELCSGSPLIFLETITGMEAVIKATRRKDFNIDAKYFFIDNDANTLSSLKLQLRKHGFGNLIGDKIFLLKGKFSELCPGIIEMVNTCKGRSIFLLDQYGYKDVPLPLIRKIFKQIPNAEILLTFSVDALVNYMSNTARFRKCLHNLDNKDRVLKENDLHNVDELKKSRNIRGRSAKWRRMVETKLLKRLTRICGAKYYIPYLITAGRSHRAYWFLHLSMHIKAWDEMLKLQWEHHNCVAVHGDRNLLGFNPHSVADNTNVSIAAEAKSTAVLVKQLTITLKRYKKGITFHELMASKSNHTIAHSGIFRKALHTLQKDKIIRIIDHRTGKERRTIKNWNNCIHYKRL